VAWQSGAQLSDQDPIVVGTDGSATAGVAVNRAAELARALGAQLHVVTAYSPGSSEVWSAAAAGAVVPAFAVEESAIHAEEIVERCSARLRSEGIQVATHACEGDPAEVLISIAGEQHAQMIVVGNRGMAGARRVLGSVPNRLSHSARCDVLIVPTS
jgi:nucleotide-binding universal stress UspA family protein